MTPFLVRSIFRLKGKLTLPGDKSIAHRAIILSSLTSGKTTIENIPANKDCLLTLKTFQQLGVPIIKKSFPFIKSSVTVAIFGKGLSGLRPPRGALYVGDSGTTCRLLLGVLAGQDFPVKVTAGRSLSRRPMARVTEPLRLMGAKIKSQSQATKSCQEEYLPVTIRGGNLRCIDYTLPVASAQVKSALLLAGLYAQGTTVIKEPIATRDHTERMLKFFHAVVSVKGDSIRIKGKNRLVSPKKICLPGDISSASFFIVLGAILAQAEVVIENVNLNPTRLGFLNVLKDMGARVVIKKLARQRLATCEPAGTIIVRNSVLKGAKVKASEVPFLIDELPILMVAASVARGKTVFEGVQELRVKETDRIASMSEGLKKMGARILMRKTGGKEDLVVQGVLRLAGAQVRSFGDHRTAMSLIVAGLAASGHTRIDDVSCISKSFPEFISIIKRLVK